MRPELAWPPRKPVALSTAGSRMTVSVNAASFFCIAWNETSWSAWIEPLRRPVSCCGKKPLGTLA
jgi:hypothetical protein